MINPTQLKLRLAVVIASFLFSTAAIANTAEHAVATIEKLHETLLEVMQQSSALGFDGRVDKLNPVLAETFDFATISRIVTGRHWKTLDEAKQNEFIDVFEKLSAATYASNFSGFSGEQFKTISADEKRGRYVVRTVIVKSDNEEIPLDYVLSEKDGVWQIVNVIAAGVSDLSLKRADYTAVIDSEGFDSLLSRLNNKITDFNAK